MAEGATFETIEIGEAMKALGVKADEYTVFAEYADTCRQVYDQLQARQGQQRAQKVRKCAAATALKNIMDMKKLPSTSGEYKAFIEFMSANVDSIVKHQQAIKTQIDEGKLDVDTTLKAGRQELVATASTYLLVFAITANLAKLSGKRISKKDENYARQQLRTYSDALQNEIEDSFRVPAFVCEACMSEAAAEKTAEPTKKRAKEPTSYASEHITPCDCVWDGGAVQGFQGLGVGLGVCV